MRIEFETKKQLCGRQVEPYRRLLLLPKHLPVGLAVGIEAITYTAFPGGFQFGLGDVPILAVFLQNGARVRVSDTRRGT